MSPAGLAKVFAALAALALAIGAGFAAAGAWLVLPFAGLEVALLVADTELPDGDVIVVSNREPYVHERVRDRIQLHVPASGLVSALEPITRTCAGTWIAHGSGSADMEVVDADSRIAVPPSNPAYTLRRVWLRSSRPWVTACEACTTAKRRSRRRASFVPTWCCSTLDCRPSAGMRWRVRFGGGRGDAA